jgi:hypothetical protein
MTEKSLAGTGAIHMTDGCVVSERPNDIVSVMHDIITRPSNGIENS